MFIISSNIFFVVFKSTNNMECVKQWLKFFCVLALDDEI